MRGQFLVLLLMLSSGPHVDVSHPWPMSLISSIFGTDDDGEITTALYTIANVSLRAGLAGYGDTYVAIQLGCRTLPAWD